MCEIDNSTETNNSYSFFRHAKSCVPEIIEFKSPSEWIEACVSNLANRDTLIGYLYFSNTFYVRGKAKDSFLSSEVFSFLDKDDIYIEKFLKAFKLLLHIAHSNALVDINLKKKEFYFFAEEYSKSIGYLIDSNSNCLEESRSFEYSYKNELINDLNKMITPLIDKDIKDIDDLTASDIALLEILTV